MIIAIGNKARQGKDYLARTIQSLEPNRVKIYHFADALKEECREMGWRWEYKNEPFRGFSLRDMEERMRSKADVTLLRRHWGNSGGNVSFLQFWAEVRRSTDSSYWVRECFAAMRRDGIFDLENNLIAVIPDLRYKNEADWVEAMGGFCVQIRRMQQDGKQYIDPDRDPEHVSETEMDEGNYAITFNSPETGEHLLECGMLEMARVVLGHGELSSSDFREGA